MPLSRSRRLAAALAAATAVALVPLTVAPAQALPVQALPAQATPAAASSASAAATPTAAGSLTTAPQRTVRWVKVDRAKVTSKRHRASRVVARPDDGTRLVVLDRSARLLKVRLPGGKAGWIGKRAVTTTPLKDVRGQRFTTGRVAVTKQVRPVSRSVERAALGTKVVKLARTTNRDVDRVKVRLPNGKTGWVPETKLRKRDVWGQLARCESGNRPRIATGNGYYGMYQFTARTWRSVGGSGLPHRHSAKEQTKRAQILQHRAGWGQWPHCTRKLGLR